MITTEGDTEKTEDTDSGIMPNLQLGELTPEELNDELSKWISSLLLDEGPSVTIDDFPEDVADISELPYPEW